MQSHRAIRLDQNGEIHADDVAAVKASNVITVKDTNSGDEVSIQHGAGYDRQVSGSITTFSEAEVRVPFDNAGVVVTVLRQIKALKGGISGQAATLLSDCEGKLESH